MIIIIIIIIMHSVHEEGRNRYGPIWTSLWLVLSRWRAAWGVCRRVQEGAWGEGDGSCVLTKAWYMRTSSATVNQNSHMLACVESLCLWAEACA